MRCESCYISIHGTVDFERVGVGLKTMTTASPGNLRASFGILVYLNSRHSMPQTVEFCAFPVWSPMLCKLVRNMKNCFSPVPLNDAFCPTPANKNMKLRKTHFHFMMAVLPRLPTRTKQIIKWVFHFMMTILPRLPSKNKQVIKWNSVVENIKYVFFKRYSIL